MKKVLVTSLLAWWLCPAMAVAQNLGETLSKLKEVNDLRDMTSSRLESAKAGEDTDFELQADASATDEVVQEIEDVGEDISATTSIEDILGPPDVFHYAGFGKDDPFEPPADTAVVDEINAPTGYEIPIVSPLQVSLNKLSVAGVWELEQGKRRAMILVSPSNEGIVAKVGDPIGLAGKIVDISDQGVLAREYSIREDGSRDFEDKLLVFGARRKEVFQPGGKVVLKPGEKIVEEKEEAVEKIPAANTKSGIQIDADKRSNGTQRLLDSLESFSKQAGLGAGWKKNQKTEPSTAGSTTDQKDKDAK